MLVTRHHVFQSELENMGVFIQNVEQPAQQHPLPHLSCLDRVDGNRGHGNLAAYGQQQ